MAQTDTGSSVGMTDALHQGFEAAMARIVEMKGAMGKTLVESFSTDEWATWDATTEKALVVDVIAIDQIDPLDDDVDQLCAA